LLELLIRFHDDWVHDRIDKEKVLVIRFDSMMTQFESLMTRIVDFTGHKMTDELQNTIQITAENQRRYESGHSYNLEKFGLTEDQIRKDCEQIYRTFLI
jgi:hypothetical protein